MTHVRSISIIFWAAALLSEAAGAGSHWVTAAAEDGLGDGTEMSPWSLRDAAQHAGDNSVVYVLIGNYADKEFTISGKTNVHFIGYKDGSGTVPVIATNVNPVAAFNIKKTNLPADYPTLTTTTTGKTAIKVVNCNNVDFQGFAITGYDVGVYIKGANGGVSQWCDLNNVVVSDFLNQGVLIDNDTSVQPGNATTKNCGITNCFVGNSHGTSEPEAYMIRGADHSVTGCYAYSGEGGYLGGIHYGFVAGYAEGILFKHCQAIRVPGNDLYRNMKGFAMTGDDTNTPADEGYATGCRVEYCTVKDCGIAFLFRYSKCQNNRIKGGSALSSDFGVDHVQRGVQLVGNQFNNDVEDLQVVDATTGVSVEPILPGVAAAAQFNNFSNCIFKVWRSGVKVESSASIIDMHFADCDFEQAYSTAGFTEGSGSAGTQVTFLRGRIRNFNHFERSGSFMRFFESYFTSVNFDGNVFDAWAFPNKS